jgi:hypothetical protein
LPKRPRFLGLPLRGWVARAIRSYDQSRYRKGRAPLSNPAFNFREVPGNAAWGQIHSSRKISCLFQFVDGRVSKRNKLAKFLSADQPAGKKFVFHCRSSWFGTYRNYAEFRGASRGEIGPVSHYFRCMTDAFSDSRQVHWVPKLDGSCYFAGSMVFRASSAKVSNGVRFAPTGE